MKVTPQDAVRDFFRNAPGRRVATPWLDRHKVEANPGGWFDVTSGNSGTVYRVYTDGRCTCEAGQHWQPCTHVLAVHEYAAEVLRQQAIEE